MGLQVWLPLDGTLDNNGVMDIALTGTPVWSNEGKVGCKSLQSPGAISCANPNMNFKDFSVCFWVKCTGNGGFDWAKIVTINTKNDKNGTSGNLRFEEAMVSTSSKRTLSDHNNSSYDLSSSSIVYSTQQNVWIHAAFCYESSTGKITKYANGQLIQETTGNTGGQLNGYFQLAASYAGLLNDFRLYDHVLSAKEVKEISKGLVLHLPLNETSFSMDSISLYTDPMFLSGLNSTHVYNNSGNGTVVHSRIAKTADNPYAEATHQLHIKTSGAASPGHGGFYFANSSRANAIFKYYITAKIPIGYTLSWESNATGDGTWYQWQTPTAGTGKFTQYELTLRCGASGSFSSTGFFYINGGSTATASAPVEWDVAYAAAFDCNSGIVYDTSGYKRNGTKAGAFRLSTDTVKSTAAYDFSGGKKISVSNLPIAGLANSYTFSWWCKGNIADRMMWGFSDGNRLNYFAGFYWNTGDGGNNPFRTSSGATITIPSSTTWHHYAVTGNGSSSILYVDGQLYGTALTFRPVTGTSIYLNGWNSAGDYNFNGLMSDFRIYATALSAVEVKELYETRFSVTDSAVLCDEYVEKGKGNLLSFYNEGARGWNWSLQTGDKTIEEYIHNGVRGVRLTRGNLTATGWSYISFNGFAPAILSPNTSYTLMMDIYSNVAVNFSVDVRKGNATGVMTSMSNVQTVAANTWTNAKFKFTTLATLPVIEDQFLYFHSFNSSSGVSYIFKNIRLVKDADEPSVSFSKSGILGCSECIEDVVKTQIHAGGVVKTRKIVER